VGALTIAQGTRAHKAAAACAEIDGASCMHSWPDLAAPPLVCHTQPAQLRRGTSLPPANPGGSTLSRRWSCSCR
jgi:hypothetical protein